MLKRIIAIAAALAMTVSMAACAGGKGGQNTNNANNGLGDKAYTQQAFDGAMTDGLLAPAVNTAGELVTASQKTDEPAVVTVWDAQGKQKSQVTTDVTDKVSFLSVNEKDEVYLLASPEGGVQTVHVLDASGKTAKKIELEGMKVVSFQPNINRNGGQNGTTAPAQPDTTAAPETTASPSATAGNGGNGGNGGFGGFGNEGQIRATMRSQVSAMQAAPGGGVFVAAMGAGVLQFDETGKQVREMGGESISAHLAVNEQNQLLVYSAGGMGQGGGTPTLKTYDPATGKELASAEVTGVSNIQSMFYDKAGKRLLYMTDAEVKLLGLDGKSGGTLATFSDFSLLNGARQITSFAVDGSGTLYLEAYNTDTASSSGTGGMAVGGNAGGGPSISIGGSDGGGMMFKLGGSSLANEMIRLGLVDASTIKERKVITMAAINSSRILQQAISQFQIAHPEYKIELKVYNTQVQGFRRGGNQFDMSSLIQAFNTDLMSGKGADIIVLDNLPWYKYADKGLLLDLAQLMAEKQFDASKYYENILEACKTNGKLFGVPMSFDYRVLTGKKETMPTSQNPTLKDFIDKAKALPDNMTAFGQQDAMQTFYDYLPFSFPDLINTATHTAKFDSPEFIQAMKDFKDLIGENTSTEGNQDFRAKQLDGSVAYNIESMSNPMMLATLRAIFGDDLMTSNVPTISGTDSRPFTASLLLGINANTKYKDMAWQFIKTMLGEDIQGTGRLEGYPVLKSATQAIIDDMKSGEGLGAGGKRMVLRMGDREVEVKPLTDADYKAIEDMLPTLNSLQTIDPNIQKVLSEELPSFFSGQKTAEDVAGFIQNRVNTILNE